MARPVHRQQVREGDDAGVPGHLHRLGVAGAAAAHLLVRRVGGVAGAVAHARATDSRNAPGGVTI